MNIKHKVTIQKLLSVNLSKCRVVWTQKILLNAQDVTFIVALFFNDAFADKEGSHSINQILKDIGSSVSEPS